jgi:hypothetical protein
LQLASSIKTNNDNTIVSQENSDKNKSENFAAFKFPLAEYSQLYKKIIIKAITIPIKYHFKIIILFNLFVYFFIFS